MKNQFSVRMFATHTNSDGFSNSYNYKLYPGRTVKSDELTIEEARELFEKVKKDKNGYYDLTDFHGVSYSLNLELNKLDVETEEVEEVDSECLTEIHWEFGGKMILNGKEVE